VSRPNVESRAPGSGGRNDPCEHEPVVSLAAHGLNGCRLEAWPLRDGLEQPACALNARIVASCVEDAALAHDIVHEDGADRAREAQSQPRCATLLGLA
jgi:hypothetical protein